MSNFPSNKGNYGWEKIRDFIYSIKEKKGISHHNNNELFWCTECVKSKRQFSSNSVSRICVYFWITHTYPKPIMNHGTLMLKNTYSQKSKNLGVEFLVWIQISFLNPENLRFYPVFDAIFSFFPFLSFLFSPLLASPSSHPP